MKSIFFCVLTLFAICSFAEKTNAQALGQTATISCMDKVLYQSLGVFQVNDSQSFASNFMKKAELVDATGQVISGRKAIAAWHRNLVKDCPGCSEASCELIEKHTRKMNPAMAITIATARVQLHDSSIDVTYHFLIRRIDGKWYVETCTVIPLETSSDLAANAFGGH